MLRQYRLKCYNFRLILWVIMISIIGILLIGSAKSTVQSTQILGLGLGLAALIILSLWDYKWILRFYWIIYVFVLALLIYVAFKGETVNGATRWIRIGSFQFQPSDIAKIGLILFFAKIFSKYEEKISKFFFIMISVVLLFIPWYLIKEKQPDLSTSIVLLLIFCAMYYVAGLSRKIILGMILVFVPLAVIFVVLITRPNQKLLQDYQMNRIMAWINPEEHSDEAYQQVNSKIAIGSGQLYGKGLDNDDVDSVKNANFIAEPQTDFIFAVAGEELGFIGCSAIILLEFLIALECILMGRHSKELAGTLLCTGVGSLVFFQSFINICVTTGLMPNTGLTLPFVSYGSTSLVTFCAGIGMVINVGLQSDRR